jgi:hypothetical protein
MQMKHFHNPSLPVAHPLLCPHLLHVPNPFAKPERSTLDCLGPLHPPSFFSCLTRAEGSRPSESGKNSGGKATILLSTQNHPPAPRLLRLDLTLNTYASHPSPLEAILLSACPLRTRAILCVPLSYTWLFSPSPLNIHISRGFGLEE